MKTVISTSNRTLLDALSITLMTCLSVTLLACSNPDTPKTLPNEVSPLDSGNTPMDHDAMDHEAMAHGNMDHEAMNHDSVDHAAMNHENMNAHEPAPALGQDYSIYQVGGDWTDQNGNQLELDELKGKNQVFVMAYTSCQHTCPILVRAMKQIDREMSAEARANTEFVFVTLDTQRDTVPIMKNYAEHNELDDNWRLIRSDAATTRLLANTLNIKYKFADNGDINHSNLISILDDEGRLVAQEIGVADSGIKPLIEYLNTHS